MTREEVNVILRDKPLSTFSMTNFDNTIDDGMEAALKAGFRSEHSAYDFHGDVWYQDGKFYEIIMVYHEAQGVFSASTLRELMIEVNEQFGWK